MNMPFIKQIPHPDGLMVGRKGHTLVLTLGERLVETLGHDIDALVEQFDLPLHEDYQALHLLREALKANP
ncbi:MAG: hypothetical protein ABTR20_13375 [Candidatus Competibacter sp.]